MKYDIWMNISFGMSTVLEQANTVMTKINDLCGDHVLINGLHRIGCAYRVQVECRPEIADKIRVEIVDPLGLKMEVTRGFSAS